VPQKASKLKAAIIVFTSDMATALGRSVAFARLEGPGLPNGPETLAAGNVGAGEAVTGIMNHKIAKRIELGKSGISIQKGEEIQIFGEVTVADLGAYEIAVTLEFEK